MGRFGRFLSSATTETFPSTFVLRIPYGVGAYAAPIGGEQEIQ